MDFPQPYRIADRILKRLNRSTAHRFDSCWNQIKQGKFDELNVFRLISSLYTRLMDDNETAFRELYATRYREMLLYLNAKWPEEDELDDLVEAYLARILTEPNPVTHYAYDAECLRKRDRAIESVNSVDGVQDKDLEFQRAMRYWAQQTGFYIDIVADDAAIDAMKRSGVKKVIWRTEGDEKVCRECKDYNGKVFSIDNVPDKPHPRCRCWLEPVR